MSDTHNDTIESLEPSENKLSSVLRVAALCIAVCAFVGTLYNLNEVDGMLNEVNELQAEQEAKAKVLAYYQANDASEWIHKDTISDGNVIATVKNTTIDDGKEYVFGAEVVSVPWTERAEKLGLE